MKAKNRRGILFWLPTLLLLPLLFFSLESSVQSGKELHGFRDIAARILPISLVSSESGIHISYRDYRDIQSLYADRLIQEMDARVLRWAILESSVAELANEFGIESCARKDIHGGEFVRMLGCLEKIETVAANRGEYQARAEDRMATALYLIDRGVAFTDIAQQYGEIYYEGERRITIEKDTLPFDITEGQALKHSDASGAYLIRLISQDENLATVESLGYPPATKGELIADYLSS
jgi:hypothetical protein